MEYGRDNPRILADRGDRRRPVGLAAAARLIARNLPVKLYEAGSAVGANLRDWGHVRVFTPWRYCVDAAAAALLDRQGWRRPDANRYPTGAELVSSYLEPLAVLRPMPDYTDRAYWQGTIKMSLSKFFVLCVLHQKPMHGYEVVQAVERTTNGCCSPTEGTVYPVLNEFEAGGYLDLAWRDRPGPRAEGLYPYPERARSVPDRRGGVAGGDRLHHRQQGGGGCAGHSRSEATCRCD